MWKRIYVPDYVDSIRSRKGLEVKCVQNYADSDRIMIEFGIDA
jgi:hypothetical protein